MCYRDMTFCKEHETCEDGKVCGRALTHKVKADADLWWGDTGAPICSFVGKPECYKEMK